jgi:hypothetical protein
MSQPAKENEADRLNTLWGYGILDTHPEERFDDLTWLAASICQTPIALISLVDEDRQWFKSKIGLEASQTPREQAFCAHAIMAPEPFVIADASSDPRFSANPLVLGEPHIRFYAGAPLTAPNGHHLGALCVIDRQPRQLSADQLKALRILSRLTMAQVLLGKNLQELKTVLHEREELDQDKQKLILDLNQATAKIVALKVLLPVCPGCKQERDDEGYWEQINAYISRSVGLETVGALCPACVQKQVGEGW